MRRSAVSITSNIAEGLAGNHLKKNTILFYSAGISDGIAKPIFHFKRRQYISIEIFNEVFKQSIKVHKIMNGLIKKSKFIHNSDL